MKACFYISWGNAMIDADAYHIVHRLPQSFPCKNNRLSNCGMFTLKAVIEGSNGSQIRNPQYYASGFLTKSTGLMLPWPLLRVLKEHELDARPMHCGRMKNTRKIDTLRWQLKF